MTPTEQTSTSKDGSAHVTDERFNTISHMGALIFSLIGSGYLIARAAMTATPWHIVGFSLYAFGLCGLFLCSTLHHGVTGSPRTDQTLKTMDYVAIYLLIAGTFSPCCLVLARGALGWSIFGTVWLVSLVGMIMHAAVGGFPKWLSMSVYVILGWVAVLLGPIVFKSLGIFALSLLLAGGLLYTIGGVIFSTERPNPIPGRFGFHEIWHLFVIAGAACHYALMLIVLQA